MATSAVWPISEYPVNLGEPERVYQQAVSQKATTSLRLLVLLLLVLAIGFGGYRLVDASADWTSGSRTCFLPIALVILIFCILFLSTPALQRYDQVRGQRHDVAVICSQGVAYYHDGVWRQAKWDEIAEIRELKDDTGKGLIKEGTFDNDLYYALFFWTIGGIWRLFGGDYRNYLITTKAGEQIKLGETLSNFDDLVSTIYRRTNAPLTRG